MSNKITQLQNAVDYSQNMLTNASAGNWEEVMAIEIERNALLEKLFSTASHDNNIVEIDDKIRQIIDINKKLEVITLNARDDTRNQIMSINKGRHAVKAYAQNGIY